MSSEKVFTYVLDPELTTHDINVLRQFNGDVVFPIWGLEYLDQKKKGDGLENKLARDVVRFISHLTEGETFEKPFPIGNSSFRVSSPLWRSSVNIEESFGLPDSEMTSGHRLIDLALFLKEQGNSVVLVSQDCSLKCKARSLGLVTESYQVGQVKDPKSLIRQSDPIVDLPSEVIHDLYINGTCTLEQVGITNVTPNAYYSLRNGKESALVHYNSETGLLERIEKTEVSHIKPLNTEQVFAMHAILNSAVQLVTLQGVAGTGKTLLALAGALQQKRDFWQIYLARPIVPLSNRDIGFLPGDIKSKINPYMEPLWDNLKFIQSQFPDKGREVKQIQQMVEQEKLMITPLAYIRGRSLNNIFFIIDEAQNLTPHEVKTIISRAGDGTKIIFTGDIFQIDTPYLDIQSNGLSYLIEKTKGNPLCSHVTLTQGERSGLANMANELL